MNTRELLRGAVAAVALVAMACGGEASDSVENSPEAVPGMEESVVPTVGTGVTEPADS